MSDFEHRFDFSPEKRLKLNVSNSFWYIVLFKVFCLIIPYLILCLIFYFSKFGIKSFMILGIVLAITLPFLIIFTAIRYSKFQDYYIELNDFKELINNRENIISIIRPVRILSRPWDRFPIEGIEVDLIGNKRLFIFEQYRLRDWKRFWSIIRSEKEFTVIRWMKEIGVDEKYFYPSIYDRTEHDFFEMLLNVKNK